ncbi:hypothetical protein MTO96_012648 [Rhipicephalus appendiculatus]
MTREERRGRVRGNAETRVGQGPSARVSRASAIDSRPHPEGSHMPDDSPSRHRRRTHPRVRCTRQLALGSPIEDSLTPPSLSHITLVLAVSIQRAASAGHAPSVRASRATGS